MSQEALLPQTDRATRYVRQHLVNSRTSCTTNPQQIAVMELDGYSWSTCSKQTRLVDCRIGVVNKLDRRRRRRRVMLTTRSTCRGEIFWVRGLEQSPREKYPNFWRYPNFLITQCVIGGRKLHAKTSSIRPVVSIQYRLVTDRRTHDDSNMPR